MTILTSDNRKKLLFCMLIIAAFAVSTAFGQKIISKEIGGNPNQPSTHVNTFPGLGNNWVRVDDVTGFKANDIILMIQMQGIGITTATGNTYGTPQEEFGEPGLHEFLIIQSVTPPDLIVFKNNVKGNFKASGNIQIVKALYYDRATVTSTLTCDPWNPVTKKGGVIALIVETTLRLNKDIDVSGLGLTGAEDVIGDSLCSEISSTNLSTYPGTFTNAGLKGEGLAIHNDFEMLLAPDNMKGYGPNYTGGGGGNGRYSGGGGGSNHGKGGIGGLEDAICEADNIHFSGSGGLGGLSVIAKLPSGILFGGGGGASTSPKGNSGAKGGNGGGIVIIVADSIVSAGGKILARGADGTAPSGAGGAGGGGGGGTVALSLGYFETNSLEVNVSGGKGGDNARYGEGGGGGGGFIFTSRPTNINANLTGGARGSITNTSYNATAFAGTSGEKVENFAAVLNGFLFNSIRSSITGNQKDTVCADIMPKELLGTNPVGGKPGYTYTWQKSYDNFTTAPIDLGPDGTSKNYVPLAFEAPGKVYFRRIVKDASTPVPIEDISLPVEITVLPSLTNNTIESDQTICYAQNATEIVQKAGLTLGGGNGVFSFKWETSSDNSAYSTPTNASAGASYTPVSALTQTSWFRRTVTSGRCVDKSALVKVTVLPAIASNSVSNGDTIICTGQTPHLLRGTLPTGGTNLGDYTYKWLNSTDNNTYNVITGATDKSYQPPALSTTTWYKRLTTSGPCTDASSNPVKITVLPDITNNNISSDQTICYNTSPAAFTGTAPLGGDGNYSFLWQKSSDGGTTWIAADGQNTSADYTVPSTLTIPMKYRRKVISGLSGCCVSISSPVSVTFYPPLPTGRIVNEADTTICGGKDIQLKLDLSGTGSLKIFYSENSTIKQAPNAAAGRRVLTINPVSGTTIDVYNYTIAKIEDANGCISAGSGLSGSKKANVYKVPSANAGIDQVVCGPTVTLSPVSSVGTGAWSYKFSPSDIKASSGNSFTVDSMKLALGNMNRRFYWKESNWNCTSLDSVDVIFQRRPSGKITNIADTAICGGEDVVLKLDLAGNGPFKIFYSENATFRQAPDATTGRSIVTLRPFSGTATDIYNYSISKIEDINGCLAVPTGLAGSKKATVYKVPAANAGNDQTVCGPTVSLAPVASVGTGVWKYEFTASDIKSSSGNTFTVDTTLLSQGMAVRRFFWEETNWTCKSKDSVDIIFLRRPDRINAGRDTILHSFDKVIYLVNIPPKQWETGYWSLISGSGDFASDRITGLSEGINKFLYTISHKDMEACSITDELQVDVRPIDVPKGISPNDDDKNNTLKIKGLDLANQDVEFTVLNSAGAKVFFTFSYNGDASTWRDWDGTTEGGAMLPDGTYYYLLKMISRDEDAVKKSELLKGFIILKRH